MIDLIFPLLGLAAAVAMTLIVLHVRKTLKNGGSIMSETAVKILTAMYVVLFTTDIGLSVYGFIIFS